MLSALAAQDYVLLFSIGALAKQDWLPGHSCRTDGSYGSRIFRMVTTVLRYVFGGI
jgi:hypothetical protein